MFLISIIGLGPSLGSQVILILPIYLEPYKNAIIYDMACRSILF